MSADLLVPAGWLSAQDMLYRLGAFVLSVRSDAEASEPDDEVVVQAAAAIAVSAMSLPRPSLAAFVRVNGEWFQVPSSAWLQAIDDVRDDSNHLVAILRAPVLSEAFGAYAGRAALFNAEHAVVFVDGLANAVGGGAPPAAARDPEKPWRDFSSVSRWLSSHAATVFADARLAERGVIAPRPVDRNRELHAYLQSQGEAFEFDSVQTCRRPSRMTR